MDASAAKLIGAGLATIALAGVGVGIGNIFGSFVQGALRNPEAAPRVFGNVLLGFALTRDWRCLAGVPLAGYGFAWAAHLFFEKNRPATFERPLLSFMGDFYMLYLWLTQRLAPELTRAASMD